MCLPPITELKRKRLKVVYTKKVNLCQGNCGEIAERKDPPGIPRLLSVRKVLEEPWN
jgi:hypothetical protein